MKTKYEARLPVRSETRRGELGPEWDFSLWFALLSPVMGILLGILGVFLLYR
jgi:hypothetical protein